MAAAGGTVLPLNWLVMTRRGDGGFNDSVGLLITALATVCFNFYSILGNGSTAQHT